MVLKRVETTSGYKVCPQCGNEIKAQAVKCKYCQTELKTCPYCAEEIQAQAVKCTHCQTDLRTTSKEGSVFRANEPVKANKRLIVLSLILVLLVVLLLCRWNVWWDVVDDKIYRQDNLTSLITVHQIHTYPTGLMRGHTTFYQTSKFLHYFITFTTTAILYASIGGVVIALLKEKEKKK